MNKLFFLPILILFFIVTSCEKYTDKLNNTKIEERPNTSTYLDEYAEFIKREIIVYDKSKENSLFLRLYSRSNDSISAYLESIQFELITNNDEDKNPKQKSNGKNQDPKNNDLPEASVHVECVAVNLKPNIKDYSLKVSCNFHKSITPYPIPIASHETTGTFIGINTESELFVRSQYKRYLLSSWNDANQESNTNYLSRFSWFIFNGMQFDTYKLRFVIYRQMNATEYPVYYVKFNKLDLQKTGKDCILGTYDDANCYIGTAPEGTTAFMYPDANGHFYYTPVNGNQCPLEGSSFDNSSCHVVDIPNVYFSQGFVWNNSWYMTPYLSQDF